MLPKLLFTCVVLSVGCSPIPRIVSHPPAFYNDWSVIDNQSNPNGIGLELDNPKPLIDQSALALELKVYNHSDSALSIPMPPCIAWYIYPDHADSEDTVESSPQFGGTFTAEGSSDHEIVKIPAHGRHVIPFHVPCRLSPGRYVIRVAISNQTATIRGISLWQGTCYSNGFGILWDFGLETSATIAHLESLNDSPAYRENLFWHRDGKEKEIRMSWFSRGDPGIVMRCAVNLNTYEVMTVRHVHDWAEQSHETRKLSDAQVLALTGIGDALPKSIRPWGVYHLVIVSVGESRDRKLYVYKRYELPPEIVRLYDLTGAYIYTNLEFPKDR
ncbi:MAG: hypothetical protein A2Z34_10300 [Planctomycetes bacterium RBG_16_59_8]|nr:MAG: hypothetical protein A2Z34_10300 [Planctomycetes bacterium RBG_16_59_8]